MTSIEHVESTLHTFRRERSLDDRAAIVGEIRMLELAWRNAIVACDLDELSELWTGDYSLTAPDGRVFSRAQCLGAIDRRVVRIERCEPERPSVHVHSDVAVIVRGRARVQATLDASRCDAIVRHVTLYSWRDERWQQAATAVTRVFVLSGKPIGFGLS